MPKLDPTNDFLTALLTDEHGEETLFELDLRPEMFVGESETVLEVIREFYRQYRKLPAPATLSTELKLKHDIAWEPSFVEESPRYYYNRLADLYSTRKVNEITHTAKDHIVRKRDAQASLAMLEEQARHAQLEKNPHHRLTMDAGYPESMFHRNIMRRKGLLGGIPTGWPTLDSLTQGIEPGNIMSIIGRPGAGKTWCMLYVALHAWQQMQKPILFVSMEMDPAAIGERLLAMESKYPIGKMRRGEVSDRTWGWFRKIGASWAERAPFVVSDGGLTANLEEIRRAVQKVNAGAVFVDGAYLVRTDTRSESRYTRMAEAADGLKRIAVEERVPMVTSYQFSKEVIKDARKKAKKKDAEKVRPTLEDIYGADNVAQNSTVVLGIFQEEDIGSANKKELLILKSRFGETGDLSIHWRFAGASAMCFDEIVKPNTEEDPNASVEEQERALAERRKAEKEEAERRDKLL